MIGHDHPLGQLSFMEVIKEKFTPRSNSYKIVTDDTAIDVAISRRGCYTKYEIIKIKESANGGLLKIYLLPDMCHAF